MPNLLKDQRKRRNVSHGLLEKHQKAIDAWSKQWLENVRRHVKEKSMDETAWLIEFSGQGGPTYYGKTDDGLGLTTDHLAAIRFSRAQDAQAVIEDIGWTEAKPIEHMWCGNRLNALTEGQ